MRRKVIAAFAALALTVAVGGVGTAVVAQDGQGQGGQRAQRNQDGQRRGQMDPEQMRQRMMDAMKERLGASDEDWQALEPRVQRVMEAQQNARAGMGMGMGFGRGGQQGMRRGQQPETEVGRATSALREVLEDENAPAEQIRERLDALRAARQAAEAELTTARDELRGLLTQRQEAILVMSGMLE